MTADIMTVSIASSLWLLRDASLGSALLLILPLSYPTYVLGGSRLSSAAYFWHFEAAEVWRKPASHLAPTGGGPKKQRAMGRTVEAPAGGFSCE